MSEDAVEDFGTKEEMIRKISLGLGKVVEYGNLIISTNDVDSSASNAKIYKEIAEICDSINVYAMDLDEYDAKTIKEIYGKFENIQMFPGIGADLSKRVSFRTDYKYAVWENYVIIYKVGEEYVEIYRVVNRYRDITRIFE